MTLSTRSRRSPSGSPQLVHNQAGGAAPAGVPAIAPASSEPSNPGISITVMSPVTPSKPASQKKRKSSKKTKSSKRTQDPSSTDLAPAVPSGQPPQASQDDNSLAEFFDVTPYLKIVWSWASPSNHIDIGLHFIEFPDLACVPILAWKDYISQLKIDDINGESPLAQLKVEVLYKSYFSTLVHANEQFEEACSNLTEAFESSKWILEILPFSTVIRKFLNIKEKFDCMIQQMTDSLVAEAADQYERASNWGPTFLTRKTQRRLKACTCSVISQIWKLTVIWSIGYTDHLDNPYPSDDEKILMAFCCNISVKVRQASCVPVVEHQLTYLLTYLPIFPPFYSK